MSWKADRTGDHCLSGARVLLIEDEPLVALDLRAMLGDEGAEVVGPGRNLTEGLRLARHDGITAALLDVRIGNDTVAPIARLLAERGVPFAFYTGQPESDALRRDWPGAPVIAKPTPARQLVAAIQRLCAHAKPAL